MTDRDREEQDQAAREAVDGFEARLKAWAQRPPAMTPRVAADTVVARLSARTAPVRVWRVAAALAVLVLALTGLLVVRPETTPPPATPTQTSAPVPPLPENVVQFWLDAETPVYFVTGPARPVRGGL